MLIMVGEIKLLRVGKCTLGWWSWTEQKEEIMSNYCSVSFLLPQCNCLKAGPHAFSAMTGHAYPQTVRPGKLFLA